MKIFDKYLLSTIVKNTIATLGFILIVFSIFNIIAEVKEVDNVNYTFGSALFYVLLNLPYYSLEILNLSFLIGSIITLANLNQNRELVIVESACLSRKSIGLLVLKQTIIAYLISILVLEILSPLALKFSEIYKAHKTGSEYSETLGSNIWIRDKNTFMNIDSIQAEGFLHGIHIFDVQNNSLKNIIRVDNAKISSNKWDLKNSRSLSIESGDKKKFDLIKESIPVDLNFFDSHLMNSVQKNPEKLSLFELTQNLIFLSSSKTYNRHYQIELFQRLSRPFFLISMLFLAYSFLFKFSRKTYIQKQVILGIGLAITFHMLEKISIILSTKFDTNPLLTMGIPITTYLFLSYKYFQSKIISYG